MNRSVHRDLALEHAWLVCAEGQTESGFVAHVEERLAAGEVAYGDRWKTAGVARLLGELLEEAADLGAWSVLALQALDADDPALHEADRKLIRDSLFAAVHVAARAHGILVLGSRALHSTLRATSTSPASTRDDTERGA